MAVLDAATTINDTFGTAPVRHAVADVTRDLGRVFIPGGARGAAIDLVRSALPTERYRVTVHEGRVRIEAGDDLGAVYGLYAVSRELLGVTDLWFWNDQQFTRTECVELADDLCLEPGVDAVRYKGFFLNDEVLLDDWSIEGDREAPWQAAFETLLRLGGNLVIPGSGQGRQPRFAEAHERGLYLAQHHATPLGARLFREEYPDETPRWPEQRDRFEALWQEAIDGNAGRRLIWTLGFRGQGDAPFWEDDPRYVTDEERGAVLSEVIRRQYDLVQAAYPGAPCCVYLYGESMELYRAGHLDLVDDAIAVWSDNGYGRMVSRRQGNDNPRIPAMPDSQRDGRQGIYYHASFYDLQAANHITPLAVDPRRVVGELETALSRGGRDLWVVNASNIKPHVFTLALVAQVWRHGTIEVDELIDNYAATYYGAASVPVVRAAVEGFWQAAIQYGPHWDDVAGEQFLNHVPRTLAVEFMRDRGARAESLAWLGVQGVLRDQVAHVRALVEPAEERYRLLAARIEAGALALPTTAERLLRDSALLAIQVQEHCARGVLELCRALESAWRGDYLRAFYRAGLASEAFAAGDAALRSREHGKWLNFWRNDCLADVKQSAWVMKALMGYFRALGDGPHYHGWKRRFTYPPRERDVVIVMAMENHETDDEIFAAMKAVLDD